MGELPTLPSVFFTINKMLNDPRTSAMDVGIAIASDQVITSKILRLVNSAFYGFTNRVSTISHAIAILGFSSTKNVVLTTSVLHSLNLKKPIDDFNLEAFWKHSVAVGAIAKLVAFEVLPQKQEEAFVAGLLHDIGKLILAICAPEDFVECIEFAVKKDILFVEAEQEILGIDHTGIAAWINEKWKLPSEIAAVITNHHKKAEVSGEFAKLVAIVQVSDVLTRGLQFGYACDYSVPVLDEGILDTLGLTPQKLDAILSASHDVLQHSMIFVNQD
jgi:putative nucleotidyltransferase with HDIG domain